MEFQYFDFSLENGLVYSQNIETAKNNSEIIYLHEARKLGAFAVFFRRYYNDGEEKPNNSEPAVCIFEVNDDFFNSEEHIALHAKLWSSGKNEIYVLNGITRVDIINARRPAEPNGIDNLSIENLVLASDKAIKLQHDERFSAYLFKIGMFWEQSDFKGKLDQISSPYFYLLNYLMAARKSIQKKKNTDLPPSTIDKLLVVCILIKFLEEIKDDNGKHTLKEIYKKLKVADLSEAIEANKLLPLLNELTNEFNGKIFDKFTNDELEQINSTDLTIVSSFLHADIDIDTSQRFLWKQYDFNFLPTEIISAIYENFIQAEVQRSFGVREKSVVYTPIHLVNFLIDEVMPLSKAHDLFKNNKFKVFDPACGSGIFLVAAYKRMLQWWAINNSRQGEIKFPSSRVAQKILEDNIYGVDVKETATFVTIFSLTTALLDKLSPQEIWNNLKFEDLSVEKIQCKSFFDWTLEKENKNLKFDLIIGNPPFNIQIGKEKADVISSLFTSKIELKHKKIPLNDLALYFFETSMLFSSKVCMVIPSNILLYSKISQKYRTELFTDYNIQKIFDFTHLRRGLFNNADTPVIVVIAENRPSNRSRIEHTIVKRVITSEKHLRFEIDYYDRHYVPWEWAVDEAKNFIWKCNLLGGGRLFHLIYRLSLLCSLNEYLKPKLKSKGWKFNIGYIIGQETQNFTADYITNQDCIIDIDEEGKLQVAKETSAYFDEPREPELFTPPYILIKRVLGNEILPIFFIEKYKSDYLVFKRNFYGISAPVKDKQELERVYRIIKENSKLYKLWMAAYSGSIMVKTETAINKEDIGKIPFPEDCKQLKLPKLDKILMDDVLNYYLHLGKSISMRGAGKILFKVATEEQLLKYGAVLCEVLNKIYSTHNKSWQVGEISRNNAVTIYQFGFGANDALHHTFTDSVDHKINLFLKNEASNGSAVYNRIVRVYKHVNNFDCVFLIKPNNLRYWLQSIALRDADDTFLDLKNAGF